MSIDSRTKQQYATVFGDWKTGKKIGHGSQGKSVVYSISKSNYTYEETGALKVMNIMEQTGEYRRMPDRLKEEYDRKCQEAEKRAETELQTMYQLKGNHYIVSYLDHRFERWEDEDSFGTDLLIRMDLYKSLRKNDEERKGYTEREIVQIGKEICFALMECHKKGILHRDIKPDNIFIDENGNYLLGDFGVARITQNTLTAETQTGSYPYAAPEQMGAFGIEEYDQRIDIYGLGLTLYELANEGCRPFAASEIENNDTGPMFQRLSGAKLPKPRGVGDALADVILKACEYKPQNRYQSAEEFYRALEKVSVEGVEEKIDLDQTVLAQKNYREPQVPESVAQKNDSSELKLGELLHNKKRELIAIIGALAILAGMAVWLAVPKQTEVPDFSKVTRKQAEELAKKYALQIVWEKEYSDTMKRGTVIKQDITAGDMVARNTEVKLILSKGKEQVVVSDFTNQTWKDAKKEAKKIHVKLTKKFEESATVEAGCVISQSVKAGKKVDKNSTIELAVSVGQQPVTMPQLVGLFDVHAMQACEQNGLQYKKTEIYGEAEDVGKVIKQSVKAGEIVAKGTVIEVVVCIGVKDSSEQEESEKKDSTNTNEAVTTDQLSIPAEASNATSTPAPTKEPELSEPVEEPEPSEPAEEPEPSEPTEEPEPSEPAEIPQSSEPAATSETEVLS